MPQNPTTPQKDRAIATSNCSTCPKCGRKVKSEAVIRKHCQHHDQKHNLAAENASSSQPDIHTTKNSSDTKGMYLEELEYDSNWPTGIRHRLPPLPKIDHNREEEDERVAALRKKGIAELTSTMREYNVSNEAMSEIADLMHYILDMKEEERLKKNASSSS